MNSFTDSESSICAVTTPPGRGAVAIVRVSGQDSETKVRKLCKFLPQELKTHSVYYGTLALGDTKIDEVLVSFFKPGRSFTGEATFEINCHGSPVVTQQIIDSLVQVGCRVAEPGEFTFRAFMAGRIDLVQAEAVLDLVESESRLASGMALRQLKGGLSSEISKIEDELIQILAHLEANIDFATEDIEIVSNASLAKRLQVVNSKVETLCESYKKGRVIHDGVHVALIGLPNVGKSSLLNALIGEDKAIVTEIEGTTRDVVEGVYEWNGARFHVFDTAGIRETSDQIELLGIERSRQQVLDSDLQIIVVDAQSPEAPDLGDLQQAIKSSFVVLNKSDLCQPSDEVVRSKVGKLNAKMEFVRVSAKTGQGLLELKEALAERCSLNTELGQTAVLTNSRHLQSLIVCSKALKRGLNMLERQDSPEFVAFELLEGLKSLQSLLGKVFDDEVMDRVFGEFCLGK